MNTTKKQFSGRRLEASALHSLSGSPLTENPQQGSSSLPGLLSRPMEVVTSDQSTSQAQFERLPGEIIHIILDNIAPRDFSSLSLASRSLNDHIKRLAEHCNALITTRFSREDTLFSSQTLSNGWLCPYKWNLLDCADAETTFRRSKKTMPIFRETGENIGKISRFPNLPLPAYRDYYFLGPHYAKFLQSLSERYKRTSRILTRICQRRQPGFCWDLMKLEKLVMGWAAEPWGPNGGVDGFLFARVKEVGVKGEMVYLWEHLPWSVYCYLRNGLLEPSSRADMLIILLRKHGG